ncbi:MAG: hypothetical protein ABI763_15330 [Bacteroidota bacterium]
MSEEKYNAIGEKFAKAHKAEISKMFGKPCLKINGKAFACFFNGDMVFKLDAESHLVASALKGSKLFDPSGANRPMKEWVQVKAVHEKEWTKLAEKAMLFVKANSK